MPITVLPTSHTDHNMTDAQREWALNALQHKTGFFIETLELPARLGTVPCGLYGPIMGDPPVPESDVHYAVRGTRPAPSRMIDLPERPCRQLTVIAGPHGGDPCVLYTMFGGPSAPREPFDAGLKTEADRAESEAFWSQHALAGAPMARRNPSRHNPESVESFIRRCEEATGMSFDKIPKTHDTSALLEGPIACNAAAIGTLVLTDHAGQDADGYDLYQGAMLILPEGSPLATRHNPPRRSRRAKRAPRMNPSRGFDSDIAEIVHFLRAGGRTAGNAHLEIYPSSARFSPEGWDRLTLLLVEGDEEDGSHTILARATVDAAALADGIVPRGLQPQEY